MSYNIFTLTTLLVYELLSCNATALISSKGIIFERHEDGKSTENPSFYLPVVLNLIIGAEGTERVMVRR